MFKGRLGIDSARVPHSERAGTLAFLQGEPTETDALVPGDHAIPLQGVSMILLGPGSTVYGILEDEREFGP